MGREITLPWSCETGDKIHSAMKWLVLLSAPISFVGFWVYVTKLPGTTEFSIFFLMWFLYGFFGTVLSWLVQISDWYWDDRFPHFACKRHSRQTGEQK